MEPADWRTQKTGKIYQDNCFWYFFFSIISFPDSSCLFPPIFTVVAYVELVLIDAHKRFYMAATSMLDCAVWRKSPQGGAIH